MGQNFKATVFRNILQYNMTVTIITVKILFYD